MVNREMLEMIYGTQYPNIIEYFTKYPNEPLVSFNRGKSSYPEMERIAKICLKKEKTAKEMGFLNFEKGVIL